MTQSSSPTSPTMWVAIDIANVHNQVLVEFPDERRSWPTAAGHGHGLEKFPSAFVHSTRPFAVRIALFLDHPAALKSMDYSRCTAQR